MTLKGTENRLPMNLLSFQGIAGSITQLSKDEVSHLGSHQPPIAVGCRDIGVTNARGTLDCLSCTSSPEILCLQNAVGRGRRERDGREHAQEEKYSGVGGIKKTRGPVDCSFVRAQLFA